MCPEGVVAVALPEAGGEDDEDDGDLQETQNHQHCIHLTHTHTHTNEATSVIVVASKCPKVQGHLSNQVILQGPKGGQI